MIIFLIGNYLTLYNTGAQYGFFSIYFPLLSIMATTSLLFAANSSKKVTKRIYYAWILLAAGQIFYTIGDLLLSFNIFNPADSLTITASLMFLVFYGLLVTGIIYLPQFSINTSQKVKLILESIVMAISVALIVWTFLVFPIIGAGAGLVYDVTAAVGVMVIDFVVLFLLLYVLINWMKISIKNPVVFLTLGMICLIASDAASIYSLPGSMTDPRGFVDLGYVCFYLFFGLAGLVQARNALHGYSETPNMISKKPRKLDWYSYLSPLAGSLAFMMLLIGFFYANPQNFVLLAAGAGVVIILVFFIQMISVNENRKLFLEARREINKRAKIEYDLNESKKTYHDLFNTLTDAIFIQDEDGIFIEVNKGAEEMYGYSVEELKGNSPEFIAAPGKNNMSETMHVIKKAFLGDSQTFEWWGQRKNGEIFPKEITVTKGTFFGEDVVVAVARDISDRKEAEKELSRSKQNLQKIIDSVAFGIMIIGKDKKIINANKAALEMSGYASENDLIGKSCTHTLCPALEDKCPIWDLNYDLDNSERFLVNKNGNKIPILKSAVPIVLDEELVLLESFIDISDRKKAEELVKKKEDLLNKVLNNAPYGVFNLEVCGEDLIILGGNNSAEMMLDMDMDSLKGINMEEAFEGLKNTDLPHKYRDIALNGGKLDIPGMLYEEGDIKGFFDVTAIQTDKNNVSVFFKDVTSTKLAEQALMESEEKFRQMAESIEEVFWLMDIEEQAVIYANPAYEKIWGEKREILYQNNMSWLEKVHADDRPEVEKSTFEIISNKIQIKDQITYRIIRPDGDLRWIEAHFYPVKDEKGIKRIMGTAQDVTQRKYAEELINKALQEKNTLLQEIHHRVKNNMQIISSLLYLQSIHSDDVLVQELLTESQTRVKSMAIVHEKLYQSKTLSHINLSEYINELITHLLETYNVDKTRVKTQININAEDIDIDTAVPLGLIINELVTNSLKYAFQEGEGVIKLCMDKDQGEFIVKIADNGVGLPIGLDLIKTKTLGLQLVQRLVKQLHGEIKVENGAGARFKIIFPE